MKTKTSYAMAGIISALIAVANVGLAQEAVVRTTSTTSAGTVTEFSPDTIVVRSETAPEPVRYIYRKTTSYVDEEGNPVSMEVVKSGLPVTVQYVREGDQLVASKVIVRKKVVVPAAPTVIEEKRVVPVPPPAVIEEKRIAPPPVVEEKKTTTTTTTTIGR